MSDKWRGEEVPERGGKKVGVKRERAGRERENDTRGRRREKMEGIIVGYELLTE